MNTTTLKTNKLPVLTWNHFNVNYKEIQLSDKRDTSVTPSIIGQDADIEIRDGRILEDTSFSGEDAKAANYILHNASFNKSIIIPANKVTAAPLIFDFTLQDTDKLTCILDIVLRENSSATVIAAISSGSEASAQYADLIRIRAEENSSLNLIILQLLGKNSLAFDNVTARIEANAKVTIRQIPLGAGTALASAAADLRGYKAVSEIYADYIGHLTQEIDLNYISRHYGRKSHSEIKMTGLLLDGSKKTARGTIDFHRGCKGAAGNESENVLLLSENVRNKSVPLILCDEDDVAGNHGAAVGTLDAEHLFYLSSRGIDEQSIRQIFLDSTISRLKNLLPDILAAKIDKYNKEVLFNESV